VSTFAPHGQRCGSHNLHPKRSPTVTRMDSLSTRSPQVVIGSALSQSPLCGADTARNRALSRLSVRVDFRAATSASQTLYALRVLRTHGMCDAALRAIYRSVVVAKLLYASSAWSGFIKATDRQRVEAFLGRSKRCGYCPPDLPSFEELLKTSDQQLFHKIQLNQQHLLYSLLPPPSLASQNYNIRPRAHKRQLPSHTGHLTDCNFITRMLFTDIY